VLSDRSYADLVAAANELVNELKFPPSIAELVERADEIAGVGWLVAWNAVLSDIHSDSGKARSALPEHTHHVSREAIKRMGGWPMLQQVKSDDTAKRRYEFRKQFQEVEREIAAAKPTTANALPERSEVSTPPAEEKPKRDLGESLDAFVMRTEGKTWAEKLAEITANLRSERQEGEATA
jgi:hypothetical protein